MASPSNHDEEDWEDYQPGGYHPVRIGDTFHDGRYLVVRKLGWGHFSTVWLAKDHKTDRHVALKVVKSADRYTETALDEVQLLARVQRPLSSPSTPHTGRVHIVQLVEHFFHTGPHGRHVCMVFEVLGESLLSVVRRYAAHGVPLLLVKQIAKQILLGLDYLHVHCSIVHTDLKPENVLVAIDDVEDVIRAELDTSSGSAPPMVTGVPPSDGRGGNRTPRGESIAIAITGSQPLSASASPSSSASSTNLDRWAFAMSRLQVGGSESQGEKSGVSTPVTPPDAEPLIVKTKPQQTAAGQSALTQALAQTSAAPKTPAALNTNTSAPASTAPSASAFTEPPTPTSAVSQSHPGRSGLSENHTHPHAADAPSVADASDEDTETMTVKIADLGNATWIERHFTEDIQTRQYRSPEVILGAEWGPSADLWSAACIIFELITGGDYLFDPSAGQRFTKDDDHLAMIIELIGMFPKRVALGGRYSARFFHRNGELKHITKLRMWPLEDVLREKYCMPAEEAASLAGFLEPMLRLDPRKRASAGEMLKSPWLEGIRIPGEV
ncbi:kinase-like protein [Exidia glandulosa HHB12029]|uniref:non-specific serine/threonine protein kinase n=1 Tax=Exidia glandulosa HHB12029 TaxID=1314781 RepID=A0A165MW83_EXIGL|nr:kinase-like protein [Exidia glandulosa HHB12029]